jgi:hypothetical protein
LCVCVFVCVCVRVCVCVCVVGVVVGVGRLAVGIVVAVAVYARAVVAAQGPNAVLSSCAVFSPPTMTRAPTTSNLKQSKVDRSVTVAARKEACTQMKRRLEVLGTQESEE